MKTKLTMVIAAMTAITLNSLQKANAQANTALSNLASTTAINHSLYPKDNNVRDLGSAFKSWRVLYLDSAIYLKDSLFMHSAGLYNAFVGFQAGKSVTSGVQNAAFGYNALTANTTGSQNTALGKAVLYKNIDGKFNSGSGYQALYNNDHGNYNTASGAYSLFINQSGSENTAVGFSALRVNSSGGLNSAFGENALYNNQIGGYNTASGVNALFSNTSGSTNIAIGFQAGYHNSVGNNNVYLGSNADGLADLSNTVALGANVKAIQSNTIILGTGQKVGIGTNNPSAKLYVTTQNETTATYSFSNAIGGIGVTGEASNNGNFTVPKGVQGICSTSAGWAGYFQGEVGSTGNSFQVSDQRLKENIKPIDKVLDKIMLLKPSVYNFRSEYSKMNLPKGEQMGFIAQDIEKVFPQLVKTTVEKQADNGKTSELKSVNYIGLIPLLTKAIQNQQEEINELRQEVKRLSGNTALTENAPSVKIINVSEAVLNQNVPNPFTGTTNIQYNIPARSKSAQIIVADANGAVVKQIQLNTGGKGTININAYNLSGGTYTYSLVVNGSTVESKKMIVGK